MVMQRDFEYWGIDELLIESCCSLKYFPQLDVCQNEKIGDEEAKRKVEEKLKREDFGNSKLGRLRSWMWETIEYPWTSSVAQYLGINYSDLVKVFKRNFNPSLNLSHSCGGVHGDLYHLHSGGAPGERGRGHGVPTRGHHY